MAGAEGMGDRVYPPQPWIHRADCEDAPSGLLVISAKAAATLHPYGRPHPRCLDPNTTTADEQCVVEPADVESHPYVESSIWPEGAVGPLCSTCRGNHAGVLHPSPAASP